MERGAETFLKKKSSSFGKLFMTDKKEKTTKYA